MSTQGLEKFIAMAQSMRLSGADLEEILESLRAMSAGVIDSIRVVRQVYDIDLDEAKDVVHHSMAWSDMRDEVNELHERTEGIGRNDMSERPGSTTRVEIDLRKRSRKPTVG